MTQEEKAKAYDEAVRKAKDIIKNYSKDKASITVLEHIFPELKEGEDERIKKEILELVSISGNGNQFEEIKDWLEKQGQQSVEPDWCHHMVDFSGCSEEYRKAYHDGWNNCNMQHSQRMAELDDVVEYLINVLKHYDGIELDATEVPGEWHTSIKHIIEVLEKHLKPVKTE